MNVTLHCACPEWFPFLCYKLILISITTEICFRLIDVVCFQCSETLLICCLIVSSIINIVLARGFHISFHQQNILRLLSFISICRQRRPVYVICVDVLFLRFSIKDANLSSIASYTDGYNERERVCQGASLSFLYFLRLNLSLFLFSGSLLVIFLLLVPFTD